jgi:MFS family permease
LTSPAEVPGSAPAPHAALLSNRDVLCYLLSRLLWISATQVCNVAVGWTIYEATRSAWALGLVGLAAFAPKLALMLVSGLIADRWDRRWILAIGLAVESLASVGLLLVVLAPELSVGTIYLLFLLLGTARGFIGPAAQAMVANLVPRTELSRLVGLGSSTGQVAAVAGPAIGGLLFVLGAWVPFAFAAVVFLVASGLNLLIRPLRDAGARPAARLSDAFAGLAFIWRRPIILGAISLDLFSVLLGGATALLPMIALELLHAGPETLGALRAMPALGAAMLGGVLAAVPIRRHVGPKLFVAVGIFGLATIGIGLSRDLYLTLALLWLLGAADVFSVVIRHTLVQIDTPDAMRGRVAAVNSLFIGASNELGEFESGATAALFGLVPAIVLGGAGTIAVALLWAWMFPQLRRRDLLVDPPAG